jgi:UDP-glucose 4-epimerase
MPRVTVLGGTGLLGAAVARRFLDEGSDVTVLARHRPDEPTETLLDGARIVLGDAADARSLDAALDDARHVVDTLGAPHPAASASAPRAQFEAELPVLSDLLAELRKRPNVSLTYLSSGGAIYGDAPTLPATEDAACHPVSPYGSAKLAAEEQILASAHDDGLRAQILRVGNAYGARQRDRSGQGVVARMLAAASRSGDAVPVFGDGTAVRDYIDARDVAVAVAGLHANAGGPQVVNVGTGVGHSVLDVRTIVEEVTGSKIELHFEPRRSTDVKDVVLDVTRLAALVDWQPRSLVDGVADAWRSARSLAAPPRPS